MSNTAELDLMDVKQASEWASRYLGKNVTTSNITYLVQYGRIKKNGINGSALIEKKELIITNPLMERERLIGKIHEKLSGSTCKKLLSDNQSKKQGTSPQNV